jgi:short chain dehydrogenase
VLRPRCRIRPRCCSSASASNCRTSLPGTTTRSSIPPTVRRLTTSSTPSRADGGCRAPVRAATEVSWRAASHPARRGPPVLRRTRGRIVQIGAMTGRLPLPFNGPSSASKAALEAFADVYRTELRAWAPSSSRTIDAVWHAVWGVRGRPTMSDQSMWLVCSSNVTRTSLAGLRGVSYARLSSSTGMVRTPAVWRAYSAKPG